MGLLNWNHPPVGEMVEEREKVRKRKMKMKIHRTEKSIV